MNIEGFKYNIEDLAPCLWMQPMTQNRLAECYLKSKAMANEPPCRINGHLAEWGRLDPIAMDAANDTASFGESCPRMKSTAKAVSKYNEPD